MYGVYLVDLILWSLTLRVTVWETLEMIRTCLSIWEGTDPRRRVQPMLCQSDIIKVEAQERVQSKVAGQVKIILWQLCKLQNTISSRIKIESMKFSKDKNNIWNSKRERELYLKLHQWGLKDQLPLLFIIKRKFNLQSIRLYWSIDSVKRLLIGELELYLIWDSSSDKLMKMAVVL